MSRFWTVTIITLNGGFVNSLHFSCVFVNGDDSKAVIELPARNSGMRRMQHTDIHQINEKNPKIDSQGMIMPSLPEQRQSRGYGNAYSHC
jgi:hypothetical protein